MDSAICDEVVGKRSLAQEFREREEVRKLREKMGVREPDILDQPARFLPTAEELAAKRSICNEPLSIAARLWRKFGGGDDPVKRRKLYSRLQQLVDAHGEPALDAVSEAVAQSVGKKNPGRYFCRSVVCKLNDRRLFGGADHGDANW